MNNILRSNGQKYCTLHVHYLLIAATGNQVADQQLHRVESVNERARTVFEFLLREYVSVSAIAYSSKCSVRCLCTMSLGLCVCVRRVSRDRGAAGEALAAARHTARDAGGAEGEQHHGQSASAAALARLLQPRRAARAARRLLLLLRCRRARRRRHSRRLRSAFSAAYC